MSAAAVMGAAWHRMLTNLQRQGELPTFTKTVTRAVPSGEPICMSVGQEQLSPITRVKVSPDLRHVIVELESGFLTVVIPVGGCLLVSPTNMDDQQFVVLISASPIGGKIP